MGVESGGKSYIEEQRSLKVAVTKDELIRGVAAKTIGVSEAIEALSERERELRAELRKSGA